MNNNRGRINLGGGWNPSHILRDLWVTWRLLQDPQVSFFLKLFLPLLAAAYWILPIDLLPGMPFDDLAILILATRFFVQLAPQDAVQRAMGGRSAGSSGSDIPPDDDNVVDTTWKVVDD